MNVLHVRFEKFVFEEKPANWIEKIEILAISEFEGQRMPVRKSTRFRFTASLEPVLVTPDSGASDADSGENSGELDTGEPDVAEQDKESPSTAQHKVLLGPKDYKRL